VFVNERIDMAVALKAHGVQLGAASIPIPAARRLLSPSTWIGYSAHSLAEAEGAALAGADFVVLAPVWTPGSKPGPAAGTAPGLPIPGGGLDALAGRESPPPLGPETIWRAAVTLPIPVYALGGIDATRLGHLLSPPAGAGAPPAGALAISALLAADDPGAAARAFVAAARGSA
jgi:thiamine-phosphate pyrophosphorylase